MSGIEDLGIPYPVDRDGIVATTGPSSTTAAGEREIFDHSNLWFGASQLMDVQGYTSDPCPTTTGIPVNGALFPCRNLNPDTGVLATIQSIGVVFRRPRLWNTGGNISFRIWYTGTAQANKVAVLGASIQFINEPTNTGDSVSDEFSVSPPPTDGYLVISRYPEQNGIVLATSSYTDLVQVNIARFRNDSFGLTGITDDWDHQMQVYGLEVIYNDPTSVAGSPPGYMMKA